MRLVGAPGMCHTSLKDPDGLLGFGAAVPELFLQPFPKVYLSG
jgi:hypothetical protein